MGNSRLLPKRFKRFRESVVEDSGVNLRGNCLDFGTKTSKFSCMARFSKTVLFIIGHIPGFSIKYKNTNWFMKFLGVCVWLFNRRFMTNYTTTLKWTVYFPSEKFVKDDADRAVSILMHEFIHLWDRKQKGIAFSLLYALPQGGVILPLGLLLSIGWFIPWWGNLILGLLAILFLMPWPAPWRMLHEMRGYTMNLAYDYWLYGANMDKEDSFIAGQFTGWGYYSMWHFHKDIQARIDHVEDDIKNDRLDEPFRLAKNFLKEIP